MSVRPVKDRFAECTTCANRGRSRCAFCEEGEFYEEKVVEELSFDPNDFSRVRREHWGSDE